MRIRETEKDKEYIYNEYMGVESIKTNSPLVIVVDPGKTNMALLIADIYGDYHGIFEFSGKGQNTSEYVSEFKSFLKQKVCNCEVASFHQEQAIMKKGMEFFESQMVLTEIRAGLIELSMYWTGKPSFEENNWAWKSSVLPAAFRSRKIEKGSKLYLESINPIYSKYTHDVTDLICMYIYIKNKYYKDVKIYCNKMEKPIYSIEALILPERMLSVGIEEISYNENFSIENNMFFYINRKSNKVAMRVKSSDMSISDCYKYAKFLYPTDENLVVLFNRKE